MTATKPIDTQQVIQKNLTITNSRQANLSATLYQPDGDSSAIKTAIMVAPATGIKRQFYNAFATYLAEQSFAVITFDNEGISESLTSGQIKNCDASLITWGRYDMPAVLETLKTKFPNANYHLAGHSAGGQLLGLMDNHTDLTSVFNVACSSGQIANMAMPYKAKAMWFMDVFIPISNLAFGCSRNDLIGMGEPLPKLVAKNWRDWCNGSGYIATAFGKEVTNHHYEEVILPAMWINAPDDDIANDKNVADMIRIFPNMQTTTKTLIPRDYELKEIGHMKFFSRKSKVLWQIVTDWMNEHNQ